MKINVRFRGFAVSDSLAEHVARKVYQRLSRFGNRVSAVDARLSDVNGPSGGCDLPGQAPLHLEELHQDFYAGIDVALDRLAEAVGRCIQRERSHHLAFTARSVS
jgi:ribosomal subunit interface protein